MLIVLEGLDGAGKSTQINLLQRYFERKGEKVRFMHFPCFDTPVFGDLIGKYLRGDLGGMNEVHPALAALLFAEDRRAAAPQLQKWLDAGYVVILDRYVYSNIAFQCARMEDEREAGWLRDWIFNTEFIEFGIPKPSLNLFLDVPLGFIGEKLSRKRRGNDREYLHGKRDIHEEHVSFQEKVRKRYLGECTNTSGMKRIDCSCLDGSMQPAEAIFKQILNMITNDNLR